MSMSILSDSLPALNSYVYSTGASAYTVPSSATDRVPAKVTELAKQAVTDAPIESNIFGFSLQRVVIIILGLLIIAAGLFMLKPVHETVEAAAVA